MYPLRFTAALRNWCDAGVLRNFQGGIEAAPVGSHHRQQARRQDGASPGAAAKNWSIWMFLEDFLDSLVKLRNGINYRMELRSDALRHEDRRFNDRSVRCQRKG